MSTLFLNGPLQNGEYTFAEQPYKATSLYIADGLNRLVQGTDFTTPHLWNTVMLSNDSAFASAGAETSSLSRTQFEKQRIEGKYPLPYFTDPTIITDADPLVERCAEELIETALEEEKLEIKKIVVDTCTACEHITGLAGTTCACKACGSETLEASSTNMLLDPSTAKAPVYNRAQIYGGKIDRQLSNNASNIPDVLVLSRTRAHGINLGKFGLKGLVLDPRAGLHVTVLAYARSVSASDVCMLTTANAAANIMAYGQALLNVSGLNFRYGLHGKLPPINGPAEDSGIFNHWFLPIYSLSENGMISPAKVESLYKFFIRVSNASQAKSAGHKQIEEIRQKIDRGDVSWLMKKDLLAQAIASAKENLVR